eukprot:scaffold2734_cov76-Skeletonema_menzelii.AAC.1
MKLGLLQLFVATKLLWMQQKSSEGGSRRICKVFRGASKEEPGLVDIIESFGTAAVVGTGDTGIVTAPQLGAGSVWQ